MLKRLILLFVFISSSLASGIVQSSELDDGFQAFKTGNYEQALRLWLPLAEKENDKAQYNIGILYMKGLGVEKNEKTAFIWFKRASSNGNTDAMYNLGMMYNQGRVIYRSPKDAFQWWKKAAELGNAAAQFNLGVVYVYGRSVGQDTSEALKWWKKAAQQGNKDAKEALHRVYSEGLFDVPANPQEAKRWK